MKTIAFLLIFSAVPAFAQESPADGSIFEVLKLGDWVSYRSVTTGDMLDFTIVNKPTGTTIKAYRDKLAKERAGPARGTSASPYEVTSIRKEYVALNNGTQERFVAKSAVRMIIRSLPVPAEAEK